MGLSITVQRSYLSVEDMIELIQSAPVYIQSDDRIWSEAEKQILLNLFQKVTQGQQSLGSSARFSTYLQRIRLTVSRISSFFQIQQIHSQVNSREVSQMNSDITDLSLSIYIYLFVGLLWSVYRNQNMCDFLYTSDILSHIYPDANDQNIFIRAVNKVYFTGSDIVIPQNALLITVTPFILTQGSLLEYTPTDEQSYHGEYIHNNRSSLMRLDKGVYITTSDVMIGSLNNSLLPLLIGRPHECTSKDLQTQDEDNVEQRKEVIQKKIEELLHELREINYMDRSIKSNPPNIKKDTRRYEGKHWTIKSSQNFKDSESEQIYQLCRPHPCQQLGKCPNTIFEYLDEILYRTELMYP